MPSHNRHIPPTPPPPLKKYLFILLSGERYWDVFPQEHTTTPPNSHLDGSPTLTLKNPTLTLTGAQYSPWREHIYYPWREPRTHPESNPNTHPDGNNSSSSSTTVKWRINSRPFCSAWRLNEENKMSQDEHEPTLEATMIHRENIVITVLYRKLDKQLRTSELKNVVCPQISKKRKKC